MQTATTPERDEALKGNSPARSEQAYTASIQSTAVHAGLAVAMLMVTEAPLPWEATWAVTLAIVIATRLLYARRWALRKPDGSALDSDRGMAYLAAISGAVWGAGAVLLYPDAPVGQVGFAFIFAALSAEAITAIGPFLRSRRVFLVLAILPLASRLLLTATALTTLVAIMLIALLLLLLRGSERISLLLREISELRAGEEEREATLTRQKELLERIENIAAVGGWSFDPGTGRLEWSPEVFAIYGIPAGQAPSLENALDPFPGEARALVEGAVARALKDGTPYDLEVPFVALDGRRLWVRARGEAEVENGRTVRLVGAFQDVTDRRITRDELRTNLSTLEKLYRITSRPDLELDRKVDAILDLGLEVFGLRLGIVSHIEDDVYTVRSVRGEGELPPVGTTFSVAHTYCIHTLLADGATSFHHAGQSAIRSHPCYQEFGLESYIGAPIVVDGVRFGTLNFSAPEPRHKPFSESDHALVKLLAEWIEFELSRARVLQRLSDSEERVRLILESIGEGVFGLDLEGRATFANPAALSILGYADDELVGETMHRRLLDVSVEGRDAPWLATLSEGIVVRSPEVLLNARGRKIPTELTSTPIQKDGQIVGAVVAFRDVTERDEFERQLMSTLAMRKAILDSANYSIIATDTEGVIQTFSRGAERMLGYAAEEVVGRLNSVELHDPAELSPSSKDGETESRVGTGGFRDLVARAELQDSAFEREWTYVRKDGTHFPVLVSITAMRDGGGSLTGYVFVGADLTERNRVDRLKKEFVSTVSHELRTPLTSIRGSLGLLAGGAVGELPPRAENLIRIAARNSERLIHLINDILDMEKIESGKMECNLVEQRLIPLLEQAAQANQAFAADRGVRIDVDPGSDDALVAVDEIRMMQVLSNLVSNAAKFSPEGATVRIAAHADEELVRITVSDEGPGIPEEFRSIIFEKFSQVDSSDRRSRGGTGLGLSITRALVTQMQGSIGFDSRVEKGATFWIDLPVVSQESAGPGAGSSEASSGGSLRPLQEDVPDPPSSSARDRSRSNGRSDLPGTRPIS